MKAEFDSGMPKLEQPGTVPWLTMWVGHARPGAKLIAAAPGEVTHTVFPDLAQWVRALDAAGLIVAVWVDAARNDRDPRQWEWQVTRTARDLPHSWPNLGPVFVGAHLVRSSRAAQGPVAGSRSTKAADAARRERVMA